MTTFAHDDGGRAAAGYKGTTGDCAVRAIAIATGKPYNGVYNLINTLASQERRRTKTPSDARTGIWRQTMDAYMRSIGWRWMPTMAIGSGCTVHLKAEELPAGRLIASVSKHYVAVIDGVIHDIDPNVARGGTRCVYGYYQEAA